MSAEEISANDDIFGDDDDDISDSKVKKSVELTIKQPTEIQGEEDLFSDDDVDDDYGSNHAKIKNEKSEIVNDDDNLFGDDDSYNEQRKPIKKEQDDFDNKDDEDLFGDDGDDEIVNEQQIHQESNVDLDDIFGDKKSVASQQKSLSQLCLPLVPKIDEDVTMIYFRCPNFLRFQHNVYDKLSYDEEQERTTFDKAANVIRWRFKVR
jgi:hypothetical protein